MGRSLLRRASRTSVAVALTVATTTTVAHAQPPGSTPKPSQSREETARQQVVVAIAAETAEVRHERQETGVVYPYGLSGTAFNGASLLASKDAKRVAITASFLTSVLSELVLQGSAPLSETQPRSGILQLDGLVNKAKVGGEWRYGQQRVPSRDSMATLTQELMSLCLATKPTPDPGVGDTGIIVQGCSLAELTKNPKAAAALERYFPRRAAWYLSVKGDVSTEIFKFSDSTTLQDAKDRRWSRSGAVTLGYLTAANVYVAASGRLERTYEAAKTQAVCTIVELQTATACSNKTVGGPTGKTLAITEGEARRYLPPAGPLTLGIAGIIRRDWENKETAIEVPLYFVKDKDGGLTGGVSAGYLWSPKDDVKGARFTVFVGQAFGLGGG